MLKASELNSVKHREVGRFISRNAAVSSITDSLTGILSGQADLEEARKEAMREKYETAD